MQTILFDGREKTAIIDDDHYENASVDVPAIEKEILTFNGDKLIKKWFYKKEYDNKIIDSVEDKYIKIERFLWAERRYIVGNVVLKKREKINFKTNSWKVIYYGE